MSMSVTSSINSFGTPANAALTFVSCKDHLLQQEQVIGGEALIFLTIP